MATQYKHKYKARLQEMAELLQEEMARRDFIAEQDVHNCASYAMGRCDLAQELYDKLQLLENEPDEAARRRRSADRALRRHKKDNRACWCTECLWRGLVSATSFDPSTRQRGCLSCLTEGSILLGDGPE